MIPKHACQIDLQTTPRWREVRSERRTCLPLLVGQISPRLIGFQLYLLTGLYQIILTVIGRFKDFLNNRLDP